MLRLLVGIGCSFSLVLNGCHDKAEQKRPFQSESQAPPNATDSAPPLPPINWTKALAFRPMPSTLPPGQRVCSTIIRLDKATDAFLLRVGSQDTVLSGTGAWTEPPGYSHALHDTCDANVIFEGKPDSLSSVSWTKYVRPVSTSLRELFRTGKTLYWMSERGAGCVPVRVEQTPRPPHNAKRQSGGSDSTLSNFASIDVPPGTIWGRLHPLDDGTYIPFAAALPMPGNHGFVFMGTWQTKEDRPFFKCQCERLLRIMNMGEGYLDLLPHRFPSDPVPSNQSQRDVPTEPAEAKYYDSNQVEKWFGSKAACETAREAAGKRIALDGRATTKSGFYSGYWSFEAWYGF